MNTNGTINMIIENKVAQIIFHHPKSNSLPRELLYEIAEKFDRLKDYEEVNVIVLKSESEGTFCAGASFDELAAIDDFDKGKEFFMGFANVINAMRKSPQIVITRVQGKAVGGGVGLIAASDYTLAHSSASVKLSELALGLGPYVVGPAVERKIGRSAFGEMSIDYDWRSAEWAKSRGLYKDIFEDINDLDKTVKGFSEKLASNSRQAISNLKKILWEGTENWDTLLEERAEISGRLVLSEFTKNYIKSFKEKNS